LSQKEERKITGEEKQVSLPWGVTVSMRGGGVNARSEVTESGGGAGVVPMVKLL